MLHNNHDTRVMIRNGTQGDMFIISRLAFAESIQPIQRETILMEMLCLKISVACDSIPFLMVQKKNIQLRNYVFVREATISENSARSTSKSE